MIVYYYYFGLQITSIGVTPSAWEIFSMTPLSSPSVTMSIASLVTAINVLIAGGFPIAGLMSPKSILPASSAPAGEDGPPMLRGFMLPARDWQIEDTWYVAGLKGTGSHHVTLRDTLVPAANSFDP